MINKLNHSTLVNSTNRLTIKKNDRYYFIVVKDIKYFISSAYYVDIYMTNMEKHVIRTSVKALIDKLYLYKFARINRSTIVNTFQIKEIVSEGFGDYSILMVDEKTFSLTKKYKDTFFQSLEFIV